MPNHITNIIAFECSDERFKEIAEFVRGDKDKPLGNVDFNTLIPMPESLNIEASSMGDEGYRAYKEFVQKAWELEDDEEIEELESHYKERFKNEPELWALGKKYFENERNYGSTNWYDWRLDHWNTKWNAYDCEDIEPDYGYLEFFTAWSGVFPVIEALSSQFPDVTVHYAWADEALGSNVGTIDYKDGKILRELIPDDFSKEAYELAAEIWGYDLADEGYVLSADGTTYEYR